MIVTVSNEIKAYLVLDNDFKVYQNQTLFQLFQKLQEREYSL
jgi:UV DNA damage repair endonuclease